MPGMKRRHSLDGVGAVHAVGTVTTMDVQIDEPGQDEPVLGCRAGLDREYLRTASQPSCDPPGRRQDTARKRRLFHTQPRRISATKS
jgi:hypothetical protein